MFVGETVISHIQNNFRVILRLVVSPVGDLDFQLKKGQILIKL